MWNDRRQERRDAKICIRAHTQIFYYNIIVIMTSREITFGEVTSQ